MDWDTAKRLVQDVEDAFGKADPHGNTAPPDHSAVNLCADMCTRRSGA